MFKHFKKNLSCIYLFNNYYINTLLKKNYILFKENDFS